jgi:putative flippase GtrA
MDNAPSAVRLERLRATNRRDDLWSSLRSLVGRLAKFGVVGGCAYVVDVAVFNVLLYVGEHPLLFGMPIVAKVISTSLATVVAWLGNRYWTFRGRTNERALREFITFACACTAGLLITLATLWVSHYVLGFTSVLADNLAANVVGVAFGTAFRFFAYSRFVFPSRLPETGSTAPAVLGDPV